MAYAASAITSASPLLQLESPRLSEMNLEDRSVDKQSIREIILESRAIRRAAHAIRHLDPYTIFSDNNYDDSNTRPSIIMLHTNTRSVLSFDGAKCRHYVAGQRNRLGGEELGFIVWQSDRTLSRRRASKAVPCGEETGRWGERSQSGPWWEHRIQHVAWGWPASRLYQYYVAAGCDRLEVA